MTKFESRLHTGICSRVFNELVSYPMVTYLMCIIDMMPYINNIYKNRATVVGASFRRGPFRNGSELAWAKLSMIRTGPQHCHWDMSIS